MLDFTARFGTASQLKISIRQCMQQRPSCRPLRTRPSPSMAAAEAPPRRRPQTQKDQRVSNPTKRPDVEKQSISRGKPNSANMQRLNKALAAVGVASRRGADELIFAGKVSVNGKIVVEPGLQVDLNRDKLCLEGKVLSTTAALKQYYFAVNKPKGYVCASQGDGSGGSGDRLVVDLFKDWLTGWKARHPGSGRVPRLFTVGRLDVQSVGLIFVTNDGDWAQQVQHPSSGITKEYSVTLNRRPGKEDLEALAAGCEIEGVAVAPMAVAIDDSDAGKPNRIRMVLAEGKNREVRRIVDAAGMEVKVLRRVRIGGYRLPRNLAFGQYVELRPHEIRRVLNVGADRTV